jgi:hypothetical protein
MWANGRQTAVSDRLPRCHNAVSGPSIFIKTGTFKTLIWFARCHVAWWCCWLQGVALSGSGWFGTLRICRGRLLMWRRVSTVQDVGGNQPPSRISCAVFCACFSRWEISLHAASLAFWGFGVIWCGIFGGSCIKQSPSNGCIGAVVAKLVWNYVWVTIGALLL